MNDAKDVKTKSITLRISIFYKVGRLFICRFEVEFLCIQRCLKKFKVVLHNYNLNSVVTLNRIAEEFSMDQ